MKYYRVLDKVDYKVLQGLVEFCFNRIYQMAKIKVGKSLIFELKIKVGKILTFFKITPINRTDFCKKYGCIREFYCSGKGVKKKFYQVTRKVPL